jgi:hypothetical protein
VLPTDDNHAVAECRDGGAILIAGLEAAERGVVGADETGPGRAVGVEDLERDLGAADAPAVVRIGDRKASVAQAHDMDVGVDRPDTVDRCAGEANVDVE